MKKVGGNGVIIYRGKKYEKYKTYARTDLNVWGDGGGLVIKSGVLGGGMEEGESAKESWGEFGGKRGKPILFTKPISNVQNPWKNPK